MTEIEDPNPAKWFDSVILHASITFAIVVALIQIGFFVWRFIP